MTASSAPNTGLSEMLNSKLQHFKSSNARSYQASWNFFILRGLS